MLENFIFNSDKIKVYPSTSRNDEFDRDARLYTEQNIVSAINTLTNHKSFLMNTELDNNEEINTIFEIDTSNDVYIKPCNICIDGYIFTIKEKTKICAFNDLNNSYIYAGIKYKTNALNNLKILNGDDTITGYNGLIITQNSNDLDNYVILGYKMSSSISPTYDSYTRMTDYNISVTPPRELTSSMHSSTTTSLHDFFKSFIIDDGEI